MLLVDAVAAPSAQLIDLRIMDLILCRNTCVTDQASRQGRGYKSRRFYHGFAARFRYRCSDKECVNKRSFASVFYAPHRESLTRKREGNRAVGPSAHENRVGGRLWRKYREFRALSAVLRQPGHRSRVLARDRLTNACTRSRISRAMRRSITGLVRRTREKLGQKARKCGESGHPGRPTA